MISNDSKLLSQEQNRLKPSINTNNQQKIVLLFDIDSTLVSLMPGLNHQVFADSFAGVFGIRPNAKQMGNFAGKTDRQIIAEVGKNLGLNDDTVKRKTDDVIIELTRHSADLFSENSIEVLPGVHELLKHLADDMRIGLGLVTGNNRTCASLKLKPHGLHDYFTFGAYGCESEDRKDLPLLALQRASDLYPKHDFVPEATIIIGDSHGDIRCALANNMLCIGVATGHCSSEELLSGGAHFVVENLSEKNTLMRFIDMVAEKNI